jgi:hypothetical protein
MAPPNYLQMLNLKTQLFYPSLSSDRGSRRGQSLETRVDLSQKGLLYLWRFWFRRDSPRTSPGRKR